MQVVFYATAGVTLLVFFVGFYRRYRKYRKGRSVKRFDRLGRRIARAVATIAANSTVRKRDRFAGLAHTLIFWGFTFLFIGTVIVGIDHDVLRWFDVKMLEGTFYLWFSLILDIWGVLFIIGLVMMIARRAWFKPPQLDYTRADEQGGKVDRSGYATDDMIFAWLLLIIAVTGYLIEGLRIAQGMPEFERWSPVGWAIASVCTGWGGLFNAHLWSWWIHALLVMFFIAYIPFSKIMHIFTDSANLVFFDEKTGLRLPPQPAADRSGYTHITDFTWKELLDLDACTRCGRCHVACPANSAGTTLSPRDLILDLRTFADAAFSTPEWMKQRFLPGSRWPESPDRLKTDVAMDVIRPETLFGAVRAEWEWPHAKDRNRARSLQLGRAAALLPDRDLGLLALRVVAPDVLGRPYRDVPAALRRAALAPRAAPPRPRPARRGVGLGLGQRLARHRVALDRLAGQRGQAD